MLAKLRSAFTSLSRATRDLIYFGCALLLGFIVMPLATWLVGNRLLGPYTHGTDPRGGGPMSLLGDFFRGLGSGAMTFWLVALGPAAILLFIRLAVAVLRPAPAGPTGNK
jgi:hypothetical protein